MICNTVLNFKSKQLALLLPILSVSSTKQTLKDWCIDKEKLREMLMSTFDWVHVGKSVFPPKLWDGCQQCYDIVGCICALAEMSAGEETNDVLEKSMTLFRNMKSSFKPFNEVIQQLTTSLEDVGDGDWERNACVDFTRSPVMDFSGELLGPIVAALHDKIKIELAPLINGLRKYFGRDKLERLVMDSFCSGELSVLSKCMDSQFFTSGIVLANKFGLSVLANYLALQKKQKKQNKKPWQTRLHMPTDS